MIPEILPHAEACLVSELITCLTSVACTGLEHLDASLTESVSIDHDALIESWIPVYERIEIPCHLMAVLLYPLLVKDRFSVHVLEHVDIVKSNAAYAFAGVVVVLVSDRAVSIYIIMVCQTETLKITG